MKIFAIVYLFRNLNCESEFQILKKQSSLNFLMCQEIQSVIRNLADKLDKYSQFDLFYSFKSFHS